MPCVVPLSIISSGLETAEAEVCERNKVGLHGFYMCDILVWTLNGEFRAQVETRQKLTN